MVDYTELAPPDYRNLVINPGGEASLASTWLASNGTVVTGATTTAPVSGAGVVEYRVTSATSDSYYFAPLGPDDAQVHFLAFKIPVSRTVSFRVKLRAGSALFARVHASWCTIDNSVIAAYTAGSSSLGTSRTIDPNTTMSEIVSSPSQAVIELANTVVSAVGSINNTGWTTLEVFVDPVDVPTGATHWRPQLAIFGANPTTTPTAPAIGSVVWADEAIILDNGASVTSVTYFDGDTAGHVWDHIPYYSSSRTTPAGYVQPDDQADTTPDEFIAPPVTADPSAAIDTDSFAPPDVDVLDPIDPVALEKARQLAVAEKSITVKTSPRHLCIVSDFQLGDSLFLNAVDEDDVTWICNDVEGWWTTPEPDVPDVPRAYFDGSFATRGRYTSRVFTITGSFFPRYHDTVARARDKLIRAVNLTHKGDWFMAHEDPTEARTNTKGSQVWLAGQPLITTVNTSGRTDFSIPLRAPDSLKYSIKDGIPPGFNELTIVTSNVNYPERAYPRTYPWKYPEAVYGATDGTPENYGNAWVYPIFQLRGPTEGALRIYNVATDQEMRIVRKLYPGEVLQIDCATKQVTLNGVGNFRFYVDIDTDWIGLQPGSNRIKFSEEELTDFRAELTVMWRSGWIG